MSEKDDSTPSSSAPANPTSNDSKKDKEVPTTDANLERIRRLLISTEPEKWRVGGADLTELLRFARPRNVYEQILVRDIEQGSLALHMIQPIACQYLPGGYQFIPNGPARYSIEVRDRIFDADKAVDPKYSAAQKGKRCDILATGEIAKNLFNQIRDVIRSFSKNKQKVFETKAVSIVNTIIDRVEQSDFSDWQKTKEATEKTDSLCYSTQIEGVTVEVIKTTEQWESSFSILIRDEKMLYDRATPNLSRAAFQALEKLDQNSQIEKLGEALTGLGFVEGDISDEEKDDDSWDKN